MLHPILPQDSVMAEEDEVSVVEDNNEPDYAILHSSPSASSFDLNSLRTYACTQTYIGTESNRALLRRSMPEPRSPSASEADSFLTSQSAPPFMVPCSPEMQYTTPPMKLTDPRILHAVTALGMAQHSEEEWPQDEEDNEEEEGGDETGGGGGEELNQTEGTPSRSQQVGDEEACLPSEGLEGPSSPDDIRQSSPSHFISDSPLVTPLKQSSSQWAEGNTHHHNQQQQQQDSSDEYDDALSQLLRSNSSGSHLESLNGLEGNSTVTRGNLLLRQGAEGSHASLEDTVHLLHSQILELSTRVECMERDLFMVKHWIATPAVVAAVTSSVVALAFWWIRNPPYFMSRHPKFGAQGKIITTS